MTDLPILYSFRRCPYAMRARMAIVVSGVQVELREVVLRDKPQEMLDVSPKGTVPVLVLPDGMVLEESLDIMRWALAQCDPHGWLGGYDQNILDANDGPFKGDLDRYKYPHRYGLADGLTHRHSAGTYLEMLENALVSSPYLAGSKPGFTDIAIFPFLRQFAATDADWFASQPWPALQSWLKSLDSCALFTQAMTRYPQWKADDDPTLFPLITS
jgi:glutathione S-transferase